MGAGLTVRRSAPLRRRLVPEARTCRCPTGVHLSCVRAKPGLSFWIVCDLGFAVGLMTHDFSRMTPLVWMAEEVFDEEPTIEVVRALTEWRWPVFFPLGAALRRGIVTAVGMVEVPEALQVPPVMRSGNRVHGWQVVEMDADGLPWGVAPATDPRLPIHQAINDTLLKERIVSGWRPEDDW
jgi:hypothetical protein